MSPISLKKTNKQDKRMDTHRTNISSSNNIKGNIKIDQEIVTPEKKAMIIQADIVTRNIIVFETTEPNTSTSFGKITLVVSCFIDATTLIAELVPLAK